jgi:hypothetical protein
MGPAYLGYCLLGITTDLSSAVPPPSRPVPLKGGGPNMSSSL